MAAALPDVPTVESAIIQYTNAYRKKNSLPEVSPDAKLTAAARSYAAYLAKSGKFSHTADGRSSGDRVKAAGYAWCTASENLASHLDSRGFEARALAEKAVQGWINSPGHRENMVAPFVTQIGVGVAQAPGADPKFISVQLFARPASLQYEFQISNASQQSVTYLFGGDQHDIAPHTGITHTTCTPGEIQFVKAGTTTLAQRMQATNGIVYKLMPDGAMGLRIDVAPLEKLTLP